MKLDLPDVAATERLGAALVAALGKVTGGSPQGWLILLQGELGSGKSTLARSMLRAYGHKGAVPSPTYTLVEPYSFSGFSLYHIDLYRIGSATELDFLGWPDLDDGLRLVEWPERVPGLAEQADIEIALHYAGNGRRADVSALSGRGSELVAALSRSPVAAPHSRVPDEPPPAGAPPGASSG